VARGFWFAIVIATAFVAVTASQQHQRGDQLPVAFAHADHRTINCIECHHDFADRSGNGGCLECHKQRAELDALIETQFHDLCRGCHVAERARGQPAGPARACLDCHFQENDP
jgi:predicted CXXCH cytochrome family protein